VVLASLAASALMLVLTAGVTLWALDDDGGFSSSQIWGVLLLSATLAGLLNLWLARRIDPGWQVADQMVPAVVCAVIGTGLGALTLFILLLAALPGEG